MTRATRILLLVAIFLTVFAQFCSNKNTPSCKIPIQAKGFGFSPLGFPATYDHTTEFFDDMENLKDAAVLWNGSWRDDAASGSDAGETPAAAKLIQESSFQYCYVPVPVFGWRNGDQNLIQIPSNLINDWTNVDAREKFVAMLKDFVIQYRPPYVFLGNENDFYYESNTADYSHWLIAYNIAYDAIKESNPETLVGPVFSYEHISGQGVLNGWTAEFWQAYDDHDPDRVDIVGFTVYPFLQYEKPQDIPSDYLSPIFDRVKSKPVIITETGWPAEDLGNLNPQWVVEEGAQLLYLDKLKTLIVGRTIPVMNWLFFNGMVDDGSHSDQWKIFGSVSVKDFLGNEYDVYNPWTDL